MKNKKMVATLASLCLIVVAVVAAVVGVLAATQQSLNSTFSVTYTAKNVDAEVQLKSMGLGETSWQAGSNTETDYTHRFYARDPRASSVVTLTGKDYAYSWNSNETAFRGVAIYRFQFDNYSAHDLNVSFTYTTNSELEVKFYTSSTEHAEDFALSHVTASWADDGSLNTPTINVDMNDDNTPDIALLEASQGVYSFSVDEYDDAATTGYLFMIVILKNVNSDITTTSSANDVGARLAFTLTDPTT